MKTIARILTKSLLFSLLFTAIFVIGVGMYVYEKESDYKGKIYPHVIVNGENVGDMTFDQLRSKYDKLNNELEKKEVRITYQNVEATFSGVMINLRYDTDTIVAQASSIGRSPHDVSKVYQQLTTLLNLGSYSFTYLPSYNERVIHDYLTELSDVYNLEPEDALFEVENNRVKAFKIEKNGRELQVGNVQDTLIQKVQSGYFKKHDSLKIEVTSTIKKPDISLSEINDFGIVEKIGEGVSNYHGSIPERVHNLSLAATKFHGVLVKPGEIFSYNRTIGDVSQSTGYKAGYIIKDGQTVLGDGGGICQDSTTLFRAVLDAGLPVIERKSHAYRVKYYENDRKPGFDATVYAPSVDFKFKNDTGNYILIQTSVDKLNTLLTFTLYGKKDGRKVELSDARVYDVRPAPETKYIDDPTMKRGQTRQIDWAAGGAKSAFTYRVTKGDEIIQDRTFISVYRPWQAVFLVGTAD